MALLELPPVLLSWLLTPFGLVLGSFCNVLIHRLPQEAPEDRDVVRKPSHCPTCKARIKPWHNLPLLGWLLLRGRCASCGCRIPFRYPLVELLGGLILGGAHWLAPVGTLLWVKLVLTGFALLVLFFTDFTEYILPDVIQKPLMVVGVLFTLPQIWRPEATLRVAMPDGTALVADAFRNGLQAAPAWHVTLPVVDWKASLLGLALGYGLPWTLANGYLLVNNRILTRFGKERLEESMGMGDFKMLAWIGAFWGWDTMLGVLGIATLVMGTFALALLVLRKAKGSSLLPFGCPLALAVPVAIFFGRALWEGYLSTSGLI